MNKKMQDRTELMLDQALEMTFPASDPIAIYRPERNDADRVEPTRAPRRAAY
jgi:hypothetical protein